MFRLATLLLAILVAGGQPTPAIAKAHLIAVIPLRSETAIAAVAGSATRDLVKRLASIAGYDATIVAPGPRRDIEAAATAGAEVYVVGQVLAEAQNFEATISSYDVASDHRIGTMRVRLERDGALPASSDVSGLISPVTSVTSPLPVSPSPGTYLLVPFAQPGNKDTALEFATTEFVKKMDAKGKKLVVSEALDQVEAASSIAKLCKEHSVRGVFIGNVRHEQRLNVFLGSYPTHAEARVSLFDCNGAQMWKGFGTGDTVYYWANAGAAVSEVIGKALDTVVAQFSDAAVPSPAPSSSP